MEARARLIRRMFSSISPRYDLLNHLLSANIDRLWRKRVARAIVTSETRSVLDVCAGTGDLSLAFSTRMNGGTVIGADFSREMLAHGRKKALASDGASVCFVEADALRMPFADDRFDAAAVAFGLRNIVDWQGGLEEISRVVRAGGTVAVLEFSLPPRQPLKGLYLFYFTKMLPWIGNRVSRTAAYAYLTDTVLKWPAPERLARMMEQAGLEDVRFTRLSGGIACLHIGRKRSR